MGISTRMLTWFAEGSMASLIYLLYLVPLVVAVASLVFGPWLDLRFPLWVNALFILCAPLGVILAHINQGRGPEWLRTHYQFQIRTFWIVPLFYLLVPLALWIVALAAGVLLGGLGFVFMYFYIGYLSALFLFIWLTIRSTKGLWYVVRDQAHPHPTSWLF